MKKNSWLIGGVLTCLILAVGAYFWATGLMDSLYDFRSPLHANPPAPGQTLGQPQTRRVVFVLIDALRLDTSENAQVMPVLNELRQEGASAQMHSRPPSYSEPGYSVLFTGAWPELSDGPALNLDYADIPTWTQDNLFSAAHRAGLKTAASGYDWFEKLIPQKDVDQSFYTPGEDKVADRQVVDAALPWLREGGASLVLIHIDQVDYAGHHEGGPRSPNWNAAASRADGLLGEILATLDLKQDTLLVVSDHGQIDAGGHGGNDPVTLLEPFVLAGAGVKPGQYGDIYMVDVAPTLAALLGANLPASTQGQARTAMLALPQEELQAVQAAQVQQQAALVSAFQTAIGQPVSVPAGAQDVAAYEAAIEAARAARQNSERLPRFFLAGMLALIPAILLVWRRNLATVWWAAGSLLYLGLFNFRYAIADGRTYSLSSVTGVNDLIVYIAVTSFLSLLVSWLFVAFVLGAFQFKPRRAAKVTMGLVVMTLYLLSLPVLWSFAWNGALVTWSMPEFTSSFLSLLSLIQILMVSVVGLLFVGLAALVARYSPVLARYRGMFGKTPKDAPS